MFNAFCLILMCLASLSDEYAIDGREVTISNTSTWYSPETIRDNSLHEDFVPLVRIRRAVSQFKPPYNSDENSWYIKLVLVVDNAEFVKKKRENSRILDYCHELVKAVNQMYAPLNIFVAFTGMEVWRERNEIDVTSNSTETLGNFLVHRAFYLNRRYPNNSIAVLLTGRTVFADRDVGRANVAAICSGQAVALVCDHSDDVMRVAGTMAHEIGHALGLRHDEEIANCKCSTPHGCIMARNTPSEISTEWSSCSQKAIYEMTGKRSQYVCLKSKPSRLFASQCGNGFMEDGEDCDGGPCCDKYCRLRRGATCATGRCCDLNTCRIKSAHQLCRKREGECDLEEYCPGDSEFCPENGFVINGTPCKSGKAFCFNGMCNTHDSSCNALWKDGRSQDECYTNNLKGDKGGFCDRTAAGKGRSISYRRCEDDDARCGLLQCKTTGTQEDYRRIRYTQRSAMSMAYASNGVNKCLTALVDVGAAPQPGMVQDGTICGEQKLCLKQKCTPVDRVRAPRCGEDCNRNGVCNHMGTCNCFRGFAPPYCQDPSVHHHTTTDDVPTDELPEERTTPVIPTTSTPENDDSSEWDDESNDGTALAISLTIALLVLIAMLVTCVFLYRTGYLSLWKQSVAAKSRYCWDHSKAFMASVRGKGTGTVCFDRSTGDPYEQIFTDNAPTISTSVSRIQVESVEPYLISRPVLNFSSALTENQIITTRLRQQQEFCEDSEVIYDSIRHSDESDAPTVAPMTTATVHRASPSRRPPIPIPPLRCAPKPPKKENT